MGFHNEVLDLDAVPRGGRMGALRGRLWGIRVRLRGWIRRLLAALGLPSAPGLEERLRAGALEGIARERRFPPGWRAEEVLAWLDEAVLRAPAPRGLDEQLVALTVIDEGDRVRRRQLRLVDKYGWRRAGREETRRWLEETAGHGALEVGALSLFALLKDDPDQGRR